MDSAFVLDTELDDLQMEYLLVVLWKSLGALDFTKKSYPVDCLQNVLPVYPFSGPDTECPTYWLEKYYTKMLHTADTLRSTNRGKAVTLSQKDIKDHTVMEVSEDGVPEKTRKKRKFVTDEIGDDDGSTYKKPKQNRSIKSTVSFPHLREGDLVKKHGRIKPATKGIGSTAATLCDVKMYVQFVELALCLHAYLHYSKDLPFENRCQPEIFDRGIREFLKQFNEYIFRGDDSVDSDTCKIHCHLHILQNILMFGDPTQYDAAKGERGLKDWAKGISQTAQKCGIDIFLYQTIQRVSTLQLIQGAQQIELRRQYNEEREVDTEDSPARPVMNRKIPHFQYDTVKHILYSLDRKGNAVVATEKTGIIDKRILSKIEKEHKDLSVIQIWGEIYLSTDSTNDGQLLRGHPTFDRYGELFDWVVVDFETEQEGTIGHVTGPAKVLAFYRDEKGSERAVVHVTHFTSGRETNLGNTMLVQNNRLEFDIRGNPALRTIRVDQIDAGLLAFEHQNFKGPLPDKLNHRKDRNKYVVSCVEPRQNWAHLFYTWAKGLPEVEFETTLPETDSESESDSESDISSSSNSEQEE